MTRSTATVVARADEAKSTPVLPHLLLPLYVLLLVVEGALRKWVLPSLADILYIVRDPLVIVMLLFGPRRRHPQAQLFLSFACAVAIALLLLGTYQVLSGRVAPTVMLIGWRGYVMLPLTIAAVAAAFSARALRTTTWLLAFLIYVNVPLVLLQSRSPATAGINRVFAEAGTDNLGLANGLVRATGTFTSSQGLVTTMVFVFALMLSSAVARGGAARRRELVAAVVGAVGAAMCLLFSGSRGAIASAAFVVTVAVILALVNGGLKFGRAVMLLFVVGSVVFYAYSKSTTYTDALGQRVAVAGQQENTGQRVLDVFFGFASGYSRADDGGAGLGIASNAGITLSETSATWVENDLARNVYEMGSIVGFLFVSLRLISVLLLAVWVAKAAGDAFGAVIVLASVSFGLLAGPATTQGTVTGACALGCGLAISLAATAAERRQALSARAPAARRLQRQE